MKTNNFNWEKLSAIYLLTVGVSVLILWTIILSSGEIVEGPIEFSFHLFSEILMAVTCILAGMIFLRNRSSSRKMCIAGHSLIIYSVLNAAGYYAQTGSYAMPVVFIALFLISMIFVVRFIYYHN
ncbi:MAG: hypothetical protein DRJ13_06680 [Bacteroidetes bacterium]|nr:MAG: hypothetical protein DRJ13_06680 [Bacteroidota bacterium]